MLKKLAIAALAGGLSLTASAATFRIDVGTDRNGDGDTVTNDIVELGYSGTLATSYYFGLTPGSTVIDTNIQSVLAGTFATGSYVSEAPPAVFPDPPNPLVALNNSPTFAQLNIDTLNPLAGNLATERFQGFNGWTLTYEYLLVGAINATGTSVRFTSGYFDLFFHEYDDNLGEPIAGTQQQVLRVLVTDSLTTDANQFIYGLVDYGWCAPTCGAFVENFFIDAASGQTFFDIWNSAVPPPQINFTLDTNVNPPIPTADQLVLIDGSQAGLANDCSALGVGAPCLVRQTTLDGSATFNVPEPGTVALLGAGLLGFGALRKRRNG